MIHNEEREREQRRQLQAARRRNRQRRWARKTKATVTHPKYGSIVVPHMSNLGAIECAAEVWGCTRYPISSSSAISLRMVAEDADIRAADDKYLEPTGSP